jgi:hypothetical protein
MCIGEVFGYSMMSKQYHGRYWLPVMLGSAHGDDASGWISDCKTQRRLDPLMQRYCPSQFHVAGQCPDGFSLLTGALPHSPANISPWSYSSA